MSDGNAAEELRALLQNQSFQAPATPNTSRKEGPGGGQDIPVLDELAALIGSLDSKQTPTRTDADHSQYAHTSQVNRLPPLHCQYHCVNLY